MDGNLHRNIFKPSHCLGHEEVRHYLGGGMSKEGLRRVENHLLDCPLCSDAVDGFESAGAQRNFAFEDFSSFQKKMPGQPSATIRTLTPGGFFRQAAAIAAILVVGLVAYFSLSGSPSGDKLYSQYYAAYENDIPIHTRQAGLDRPIAPVFQQALSAYADKQFEASIPLFEETLKLQPDNEPARFFAGMASLETAQFEKAAGYFEPVAHDSGVYSAKAAWYLILIDLKTGEKESARAKLDEFIQSGRFNLEEAKALRDKL
ncbi:MAG: hypothetical protein HY842_20025 [Bacteroidetes bacterium]|nr:hypothetical protein [Bacteroidota bacterium]